MDTQLKKVAESYDKGIVYGKRGLSLYDNLPEELTSHPDYLTYKRVTELPGNAEAGSSGHWDVKAYLSPTPNLRFIDLGCCLNLMQNGYDASCFSYRKTGRT